MSADSLNSEGIGVQRFDEFGDPILRSIELDSKGIRLPALRRQHSQEDVGRVVSGRNRAKPQPPARPASASAWQTIPVALQP